jgi:ankyrin repeat protein
LIAAAGVILAVLERNWLPLETAVFGVALSLFVWSTARIVKQARRKQLVQTKYVLTLLAALLLFDGAVSALIFVISGLAHSTQASRRAPLLCLLSFIVIVAVPSTCLLLYRRYQAASPEKFSWDAPAAEKNAAKRPGAAVLVVPTFLAAGILLPRTSGWPPLIFAARGGRVTAVKLLLSVGCDANAINKGGFTPLVEAANGGHVEAAELLIERGANVNDGRGGTTPLLAAVRRGHAAAVKLLLEKGADLNATDVFNGNALLQACRAGYGDVVKLLLEKGAEVNVRDLGDNTPLMLAMGYPELVKLLLGHGADLNLKNKQGKTALSMPAAPEVLVLLRAHGAKE